MVGLSLGLVANTRGGLYGYVGVYGDLSYRKFYLTPQLAMGGYHEGASSDLGGVFQFRESLDLTYRFDNGHRFGRARRTSPTRTSTRGIRARRKFF